MTAPLKKSFISAKEAAALVGYTPDYVTQLARQEMVVAELRDRQWFIDAESLKLFSLHKDAEQKRRKEQLKLERVHEVALSQRKQFENGLVNNLQQTEPIAWAGAVVVMLCLLVVARLGFVGYQEQVTPESMVGGVASIYEELMSLFLPWFGSSNQEVVDDISEPDFNKPDGVVLLKDFFSEGELRAIENSFSDEVLVEQTSSSTGLITPVFNGSSSAQSYQYVLVPINKDHD